MRGDLTDEAEKEMLDHLWSLQYKFREMLATSVGTPSLYAQEIDRRSAGCQLRLLTALETG